MPRGKDGHINAARIDRSRRLQIILDLLKRAEHPLSSEDIARQAYDFSRSGRIMLNVSTNIGEMRSKKNAEAGYIVSEASAWKSDLYPWHDGTPRFWLIAAPGWRPKWTIGENGILIYAGQTTAEVRSKRQEEEKAEARSKKQEEGQLQCKNPACRQSVPEERRKEGFWTCSEACGLAWRESLKKKIETPIKEQARLF